MKLTLINKVPRTSDVTSFIFQPEIPVTWAPGQYFHYTLDHENADNRGTKRWFTICSAPFEENIMITTRFAAENGSSFKDALFGMEMGGQIEGDGPEGDFTVEDFSQKYVFIAGGIGITPFRSMFAQIQHDGAQLHCDLLYANRNDEYTFEDEINKFAENQPNFKMHKFTGDIKIGEQDIKNVSPELNSAIYFISGPKPMVEHYNDFLVSIGVNELNIKLDDFPGYDGI